MQSKQIRYRDGWLVCGLQKTTPSIDYCWTLSRERKELKSKNRGIFMGIDTNSLFKQETTFLVNILVYKRYPTHIHTQTKKLRGIIIKIHNLPTWPPSSWVCDHKHWFIVHWELKYQMQMSSIFFVVFLKKELRAEMGLGEGTVAKNAEKQC